jgi:hypothetical protein
MLLSTSPDKSKYCCLRGCQLPATSELEHVHLLSYVGLFSSLHACGKIWQAVRRALSFQCSILFLDSCDLVAWCLTPVVGQGECVII